jgi:hypothetical protein
MSSFTFNFKSGANITGPRRFPAALLAAAIAVLVFELFVAFIPRPAHKDLVRHRLYNPSVTPDIVESIVQWQVAHATLLEEQQDLLLLGDSACLSNLEAVLLTELTELKTWNLGTFGFTYTNGHADILRLFIERNGPPRFLVYHTSHYSLTASWRNRAVKAWVSRLRDWMAPPETRRYLLPSMRYRQEIRNTILSIGKESISYTGLNVPRGRFASDNEVRRELWENRGSFLNPQKVDLEKELGDQVVWEPRFHPDCEDGLKQIFQMAREFGFPVLILFNPLPEQADNEVVKTAVAALESDLEEAIRPYPGVSIYQPFLRFYPNELCLDLRHLNAEGARRNTEELAVWIRSNWLSNSN